VFPPASQNYVNIMLLESDHLSFFFPREFSLNLSQPFYSFSLDLHESSFSRVQSSPDLKSLKFSI
jgi:hypothetical protein